MNNFSIYESLENNSRSKYLGGVGNAFNFS